ncbi:MAG: GspMb/PilO family protein [Candidatus Spechtbacterales bacterium]|nr:GspMb/PilO family protein [Candidatus Spechtbacterales bacterium]
MNTKSIVYFSALGFGILFSWFFIWPEFQGIEDTRLKIEAAEERKSILQETRSNIENSSDFLDSLTSSERHLLDLALPGEPDRINLANVIYRMISEHGLIANRVSVELESSSRASASDDSGVSEVSIIMGVDGSYEALKSFLVAMEENMRITDVGSVIIESDDQPEDRRPPVYSFDIQGKAYYLSHDKESSKESVSSSIFE